MKYSAIMPTYQTKRIMIKNAIDSVLRQTLSDWELWVIDDNEKCDKFYNQTVELVKHYKDNKQIHFIMEGQNNGANAARNKGIKLASGRYIAFLDSDDCWLANYLETIDAYTTLPISYTLYSTAYKIKYSANVDKVIKSSMKDGNIYELEIIRDRLSPTSAIVAEKEALCNAGYFDEMLPARQDYDMWLRVLADASHQVKFINQPLAEINRSGHMRISSGGIKHIDGTLMVLDKIICNPRNKNFDLRKIRMSHYIYIAKIHLKNHRIAECFQYLLKSMLE